MREIVDYAKKYSEENYSVDLSPRIEAWPFYLQKEEYHDFLLNRPELFAVSGDPLGPHTGCVDGIGSSTFTVVWTTQNSQWPALVPREINKMLGLEILNNDYVRAARAKGLPESLVIRRHVLRPALLSIVTIAGVAFGNLLAGSVLVENVFSWPGIGQYAYRSSIGLDLPGIMGVSIVVAGIFITMNLLVDIAYHFIDPSLRHA
jgi:hypothetical protein